MEVVAWERMQAAKVAGQGKTPVAEVAMLAASL